MIFWLFGLLIVLAIAIGLVQGVKAWREHDQGRAFLWIVGLPLLVFVGCLLVAVVIFANVGFG